MFFWVARMIMAGYEWAPELLGKELAAQKGVQPFRDVYFTGMVRDNKRRKMSQIAGQLPRCPAIARQLRRRRRSLRHAVSAAAGNDIIFDAPFDAQNRRSPQRKQTLRTGPQLLQ
jgi:valyl-tRNA synthetase